MPKKVRKAATESQPIGYICINSMMDKVIHRVIAKNCTLNASFSARPIRSFALQRSCAELSAMPLTNSCCAATMRFQLSLITSSR